MTAETVAQLDSCGGTAAGFAARQLDLEMTRSATLVLALTRAHRGPVVEHHPAAARVTFTLREIARLLADVPAESVPGVTAAQRVHAVTQLAIRRRGLLPPVGLGEDDVTDPYGGNLDRYRTTTAEILPAVQLLLRVLGPR
jgi:protein-tyrosine phosphatase